MLSERERRQFDEIVRALRDDSKPDAPEPRTPKAPVVQTPTPGRWQRIVKWAERRLERRLDGREAIVRRTSREKPWAT